MGLTITLEVLHSARTPLGQSQYKCTEEDTPCPHVSSQGFTIWDDAAVLQYLDTYFSWTAVSRGKLSIRPLCECIVFSSVSILAFNQPSYFNTWHQYINYCLVIPFFSPVYSKELTCRQNKKASCEVLQALHKMLFLLLLSSIEQSSSKDHYLGVANPIKWYKIHLLHNTN